MAVLANSYFEVVGVGWSVGAGAFRGDSRCGRTLALRVHDELDDSQQILQIRLGRIGRILLGDLLQIALEQSVGAIILARVMEVGEHLSNLLKCSASESAGMSPKSARAKMSCSENCLRGQCDVVLVNRDGHRLVQVVPLVVSAYEVVKCRKKIADPESLKDGGHLSTRLSIREWHAFHDFGGHEAQADRHDGLRVRQQHEGLRIVHVRTWT